MQIKLLSMELTNFKGLSHFMLETNGQDLVIRGENATGKSTLFDGFLWLLFGKDSRGKSDFAIKTLDDAGEEIHGLDHSVEAMLEVNGKPVTLKKTYAEKWTKKRGDAKKQLTGHTVDHSIDGVPSKKKEWDVKISELVNEDTFKLLTSPTYFNSLHWQKRRDILLQVCGDVSDADAIASSQDLAALPDILGNRTLEDHKKVVQAKRSEINKRLQEIPARIDELSRSTADADQVSPALVKKSIQELQEKIDTAKAGSNVAELRKQKAELQAQFAELSQKQQQAKRDKSVGLQDKHRIAERELAELQADIQYKRSFIESTDKQITRRETEMTQLRNEYKEIAGQQFEGNETCPTCGQDLPCDQVEAAKAKHNERQATRLAEIQKQGKELKAKNEEGQGNIQSVQKTVKELEAKIEEHKQQIVTLQDKIKLAETEPTGFEHNLRVVQKQIDEVQQQIQNAGEQTDTTALEQELAAEQTKLSQVDAAKKSKARIKELKQEERDLAGEFEELERQTYLMEQFVVQKVNMLEDKINSKFALARFKLFEQQINGGISETCITTYQGVPVGYGLNTGATVAVGMDIVRTLQKHYDIHCPIWIDNRESLVELPDMDCQVLSLVVDGNYPELSIENQTEQEADNE